MERDAFNLPRQIAAGMPLDAALCDQWLDALQAISWVRETDNGPSLTPDGRGALASFLALRKQRVGASCRAPP
jgi:hypothetical protein